MVGMIEQFITKAAARSAKHMIRGCCSPCISDTARPDSPWSVGRKVLNVQKPYRTHDINIKTKIPAYQIQKNSKHGLYVVSIFPDEDSSKRNLVVKQAGHGMENMVKPALKQGKNYK